jgi:hypothetical protein
MHADRVDIDVGIGVDSNTLPYLQNMHCMFSTPM